MRIVSALGPAILLAAATSSAQADVSRCSTGTEARVAYDTTDLGELSGDTGWFPSDSAAQLRLTGRTLGETHVGIGLVPKACWSDGKMAVTLAPQAGSGTFATEYGADVHLYGQIHTSVLGYAIDWNGEIPVPIVGDLLLAGQTQFEPNGVASVSDTTNRITLLTTNLLSAIIDITGISGGLDLNVQGAMTTTYTTTSLDVAPLPHANFGATLPTTISARGVVHYAPSLNFGVAFDVRILGFKVAGIQLFDVNLPLPSIDREVTLTADDLQLPLPRLGSLPASLGFASGATQKLHVSNTGKAPLAIEMTSAPDGVAVAPLTLAPGAQGDLVVTAVDATRVAGALVLATNDPDHGSISVALDAAAVGQVDEPADEPIDEGGCSAGGGASPLLGLALLAIVRRRR